MSADTKRKGSLRESEKRASAVAGSSLPTPTSPQTRSSLPGIRSLRNRFFKGDDKNGAKVVRSQSSAGTLHITSAAAPKPSGIPTSLSTPNALNKSHNSLDLGRVKSPSTASFQSAQSLGSLLPRPNPPGRVSSARPSARRASVQLNGPGAGEWLSSKDGPTLTEGAIEDEEEPAGLDELDDLGAEDFDEGSPCPDDEPSRLAPPLNFALREKPSLDAVGGNSGPVSPISAEAPPFSAHAVQEAESRRDSEYSEEATPDASRPSALKVFLQGRENGTKLRDTPEPKLPSLTTARDYSEVPQAEADIPMSGVQSPLDDLVVGLGGRPMSRGSSNAHSSEQGDLATTGFSRNGRPVSVGSASDSRSVREMVREIERNESERKRTASGQSVGKQAPVPPPEESPEQRRYRQTLEATSYETPKLDQAEKMSPTEITPGTAKRWSIDKMEESFRNMQNMLGSSRNSTFSLAVTEDGRQTPSSASMIIDRALIGLTADSSFENSDIERLSASGHSSSPATEYSRSPLHTADFPLPKVRVSPEQSRQPSIDPEELMEELEGGDSPTIPDETEDDTLLPGHFPSSAKRPSMLSISAVSVSSSEQVGDSSMGSDAFGLDQGSPSPSRRHTLSHAPSQEALAEHFEPAEEQQEDAQTGVEEQEIDRAETVTPSSALALDARPPIRRAHSSREALRPRHLSRTQTDETVRTADGEDAGWATPRSSVSPAEGQEGARLTPTMRSRVGRYLQGDLEAGSSSDGGSRAGSGGSSLFDGRPSSSRIPADEASISSARRRANGVRRQGLAEEGPRDTWFDDTPGRQRIRSRPAPSSRLPERTLSSQSTGDESEHTISDIRRADKVQLFLRFSQVKAELDAIKRQSLMEREALLDALNESRDVVHDLRSERNRLATRLDKETASLRALSAALGGEEVNEDTVERLADLARSKSLWQQRATKASSELDRHRDDIARLQMTVESSRDRDEDNKREIRHLETRVGELSRMLNEAQDALRSYSPDDPRKPAASPESSPTVTRLLGPSASPRSSTATKTHVRASSVESASSPSRSRLSHPRAGSATAGSSALPTASTSRLSSGLPSPRSRTTSATSAASSTASLEVAALAQTNATPLTKTKMTMAPRTLSAPSSPARVSKLPGAASAAARPSGLPSRSPPSSLPKSKASPASSPASKSGLPKLNSSTSSRLPQIRTARDSSTEPPSPALTDAEWPTPKLKSSNGSFGLAEQDERFLNELAADMRND